MYKALIPILLLASGATAAVPRTDTAAPVDARIAKQLTGLVPGQPTTCISPSRSQAATRHGDVSLIKDRSGTLYMTRFTRGCTVREGDIVISRRPTERLCRGDIIETRDLLSGISSGSCSYDDFIPYRRP